MGRVSAINRYRALRSIGSLLPVLRVRVRRLRSRVSGMILHRRGPVARASRRRLYPRRLIRNTHVRGRVKGFRPHFSLYTKGKKNFILHILQIFLWRQCREHSCPSFSKSGHVFLLGSFIAVRDKQAAACDYIGGKLMRWEATK